MAEMDLERLKAEAIANLEKGDRWDKKAAEILKIASLSAEWESMGSPFLDGTQCCWITVSGCPTPQAMGVPDDKDSLVRYWVQQAIHDAKPPDCFMLSARVVWDGQVAPSPTVPVSEPRTSVDNQGVRGRHDWNGLTFNSQVEIRIAQVLDQKGVLFFANCLARVSLPRKSTDEPGAPTTRTTREPDFLICHQGKWGILEIDGEPYHPPSRTVHDHEWDRLFLSHGVKLVQHYDANDARDDPYGVVQGFLRLLEQT